MSKKSHGKTRRKAKTGHSSDTPLEPHLGQIDGLAEQQSDRLENHAEEKNGLSAGSVEEQSDMRRKRRRLSHDAAANLGHQQAYPHVQVPASSPPDPHADVAMTGLGSEDMIVHASSPPLPPSSQPELSPVTPSAPSHAAPRGSHIDQPALDPHTPRLDTPAAVLDGTNPPRQRHDPPKRMMQLKAGGRLASPVKLESKEDTVNSKPTKRPGRKKKEKHLLAVCHYTPGCATGNHIDSILSGLERYKPPSLIVKLPLKFVPPPPPVKSTKPVVHKPTHPFFSGKPNTAAAPPPPAADSTHSPRRPSAVTPGKLRAQRQQQRLEAGEVEPLPTSFLNNRDKAISRQPGMTHAPWPTKGCAHVRGNFFYDTSRQRNSQSHTISAPVIAGMSRKMKQRVPIINPTEGLLAHYRQTLDFDQEIFVRSDGFQDPPSSLRVPDRSLLTGSDIQGLLSCDIGESVHIHPACSAIYHSIPALTPYDYGRSETQAWAQKYAPVSADAVLQRGKEPSILRDWMKALTIVTVESTAGLPSTRDKDERKLVKKRRKKAEDLQGFVVNSDEEFDDMDELSEPDNLSEPDAQHKRSLVHALGKNGKVSNAVIVSGPSGCGKSAMVYAAAKELGFEVFEINSGSRRTGKDILDRVGDMVENHLVQRQSADHGNTSADEDAGRLSEAFKKDLESGRQGTMASFFASKPKPSQSVKKQSLKTKSIETPQQKLPKAKAGRGQKQSLILLEEVDVLFEEDKGFWQTVFTLIMNSKRPVVMTCNDEDLVPIQVMKLHAILRMSSPPVDLAAPYLALLAAKEGHVVSKSDVSELYKSTGKDLRATIAALQLWCQMGVGDPRGGLSWIFQRWPLGSGMGKNGEPLRVVSQGSYQSGMGLFTHHIEPSSDNSSAAELLLQVWEEWDLDPRDSLFTRSEHKVRDENVTLDRASRLKAIRDHEQLSQTLSDMDTLCRVGLPGSSVFDTTDPQMTDKYRSNYISGMALLQTPTLLDYSSMDTHLAVTCSHLASKVHALELDTSTQHLAHVVSESSVPSTLTRSTFAQALEPLAYQCAMNSFSNAPNMTYTSIDGPFMPIVLDIAPYVRSIAAFDLALETQRARLGGVESGGPKRMRTTRAARSALEGGQRASTRRERWFKDAELDFDDVLQTGSETWPKFGEPLKEPLVSSRAEESMDETA